MSDEKSQEPFIPFTARLIHRESDDEYVAKLTKYLERLDRWKWRIVTFHAAIICVYIWLVFFLFETLEKTPDLIKDTSPEWGAFAGLLFGGLTGYVVGHYFSVLIFTLRGFRTERLLIKHYRSGHSEVE